jgi:FlaG/FlaF family flagellin (archaellin)
MAFCTAIICTLLLSSDAFAQATSFDIYGYRANEGGGGALDVKWTKGNLGNTWAEGEWVAYKMVVSNVQTNYPNFAGLPDLTLSFDFTNKGDRFIDLIRGIQVSTTDLTDSQGWPDDVGSALPLTTRTEIEEAQNDFGNTGDLENIWTGFSLLRTAAPVSFGSQIASLVNRDLLGNDGTPTDERHTFTVPIASLLEAGIPSGTDTVVIYFQLHESRSFIWFNSLQSGYDQSPSDDWGGYLYSLPSYAADSRNGSGYVPGSSGHIHLENVSGSKDVPIPIPEQLPGAVSGLKWHDEDGNGVIDGEEQTLSGWRIYVSGSLEGIDFSSGTITDEFGNYSFPNLTSNVVWSIREDAQRYDPSTMGWMQTYPLDGTVFGVGTGFDFGASGDTAAIGWKVALTLDVPDQADMNFGNMLCEVTLTCPPDDTVDCNDITDPSNTGYPTVESNCPPNDTTYSDVVIYGDCDVDGYLYQIERTWVVTDVAGMADTCLQIITVVDTTPPVITGVGADETIECPLEPVFSMPTASDDCSTPVLTYVDDTTAGDCPQEYSITRTWTAEDDCGNTATDSQTITVVDDTPPVISGVGADETIECPVEPVFSMPTAEDACGPAYLTYVDDTTAGDCPQEYSITRTWTAEDDCGNSSTDSQTITVVDDTPPVISGVGADETIECPVEPVFSMPTAEDACGPAYLTYVDDTTAGDCPQEYSITRTWTAEDDCGNSSTDSQTITVVDETAPVISGVGADETIECPLEPVFSTPTAEDACGPAYLTYVDDTTAGDCPQEYSITRTWTAEDDCGNSSTDSQTITVVDETAPVITGVGADETIECPDEPVFSTPTAEDACGPAYLTYVDDTTAGDCPQEYSITRTWTAEDDCGNSSTDSQTINVVDTVAPVITCPPDTVFECDDVGEFGMATAVDECDPELTIEYVDDTVSYTCPLEINRTWTATDDCGNSASCVQNIIIKDETPPVISGVGVGATIECPAEPVFSTPTAADACDPDPSLTYVDDTTAGDCPQEYSVTRTWTATDYCGNSSTASQTITVVDNTPPVITGVGIDAPIECPAVPVFSTPTAEDACGPAYLTYVDDTTAGDCPQEYSVTRTWTAEDDCGNSSTDSQTITVVDNTPPVITGVGDDETIECPAEPVFSTPTAEDACGPASLTNVDDTTFGDCPQEYSITRTWTAEDDCGNTATANQTINVVDTTAPVIACAVEDTIACEDILEFTPPNATDNCDPAPVVTMIGVDTTDGPGFGETTYTAYWYAEDACGNISDTCSQTIVRICPEPCTFTMGGWGSDCPESQQGDMMSTQPGCIRDHYFSTVFPGGYVMIGHPDGFTAQWNSSSAVAQFLPAGGTPSVLTSDLVDPMYTPAGVLAGQVLALRLNREYSCAGVFDAVELSPSDYCYGEYVIPGSCGKFAGLTVDEFLGIADMALSGDVSVLDGYSATLSDLNYTATCLNEQFDECDPYANTYTFTSAEQNISNDDTSPATPKTGDAELLPTEFSLDQNYPNPFNPKTQIKFALPVAVNVKLEVYNVIGQRVATLVNEHRAAGYHTVTWDASYLASGVYFYRLQADQFVDKKKMLLMK